MQVIKCNSNVMAITCHISECNALHYNYVMRKKCPLQITFHYFENVIHYNYITITIAITPGLHITDKIFVGIIKHHFLQICDRVMALDLCQKLFFAQYLENEFNQILLTHYH